MNKNKPMTKQPYSFVYAADNIGDVLVTHSERSDKEKADTMEITKDSKLLASVKIPFSTNPATAMKLVDEVCRALDYVG